MVGIPILVEKLMQIQEIGICNCLPDIVKKIESTLSKRQLDLVEFPMYLSSLVDAMLEIMKVMDAIKDMLNFRWKNIPTYRKVASLYNDMCLPQIALDINNKNVICPP